MQNIEHYVNESLHEEYYFKELSNGLKVYIINKPGFKEFTALININYGSNNTKFTIDNKQYELPTGIAHFLEHKLFACKDGVDAGIKLTNLGLYCNAYTSNNETNYYFSGTNNFLQGLNILLDFVQEPFFTDENVENEKEIIVQELMMYKDMPKERLMEELKNNLYFNNHIKNDIGGSVEDVKKTTKEDLFFCHQTFYHPSNMILGIIGDINIEDTLKEIESNQNSKKYSDRVKYVFNDYNEPLELNKEYCELKMDVTIPQLAIGIKLPFITLTKEEIVLDRIYINTILKYHFALSSRFNQSLINKQLITNNLKYGYIRDDGARYIYLSCDTLYPNKVLNILKKKLNKITTTVIPKKRVDICQKTVIGSWIANFNFLSDELFEFVSCCRDGIEFFDLISLFRQINSDDIQKKCASLDFSTLTYNIIYPQK